MVFSLDANLRLEGTVWKLCGGSDTDKNTSVRFYEPVSLQSVDRQTDRKATERV